MSWFSRLFSKPTEPRRHPKVVNPYLMDASNGLACCDNRLTRQLLYTQLHNSSLLIPTAEPPKGLESGETSCASSESTSISIVGMSNSAGEDVLSAFTDSEAYQAGAPPTAHCLGLYATDFFGFVLQQTNASAVVLNPGGPLALPLPRSELTTILRQFHSLPEPTGTLKYSLIPMSEDNTPSVGDVLSIHRPTRKPTPDWIHAVAKVLAKQSLVSSAYLYQSVGEGNEMQLAIALLVSGGIDEIGSSSFSKRLKEEIRAECLNVRGPDKSLEIITLLDRFDQASRTLTDQAVLVYQRPNCPANTAASIRQKAETARLGGSDWTRYAIPIEGITFLSMAELKEPPIPVDATEMPDEVRAQIESLDSVVRTSGRLAQPVTVWSGLALEDSVPLAGVEPSVFAQVFPPSQVLQLRGFVSGSTAVEPPLFAAGERGAMLEITIHAAAHISAVMPRIGEDEYLLPRDCRCRVIEVVPQQLYRMENGDSCTTTAIRLAQL